MSAPHNHRDWLMCLITRRMFWRINLHPKNKRFAFSSRNIDILCGFTNNTNSSSIKYIFIRINCTKKSPRCVTALRYKKDIKMKRAHRVPRQTECVCSSKSRRRVHNHWQNSWCHHHLQNTRKQSEAALMLPVRCKKTKNKSMMKAWKETEQKETQGRRETNRHRGRRG